jgi:hypothetical protein
MMMTMEPQVLKEVGRAPEDFLLLEARQEGLLTLIGELLQQNEELRMKVARLEGQAAHTPTSC